jgi:hypothetical protein
MEVSSAYSSWPVIEFSHGLCMHLKIPRAAAIGKLANLGRFFEINGSL